jgi:hypothetical protein
VSGQSLRGSRVDPTGLSTWIGNPYGTLGSGNPGWAGTGGGFFGGATPSAGNWYWDSVMGWQMSGTTVNFGTVGTNAGTVSDATNAYFDNLDGTKGDVTQERDDSEPGAAAQGPSYILFVGYAGTLDPYNYWHYVVVNSSKSIVTNATVREVLTELFSWGLPTDVQGGNKFTPFEGEIYDQMGTMASVVNGISWGLQSWQVEVNGVWVDNGPTTLQIINYQNGQLVQAEPIQLNNPTPFTNPAPYGPQGSFPPGKGPP